MSEFFEDGAGIDSHLNGVRLQLKALHANDTIPQGEHIDIVLGMANQGGPDSSVLLEGDQGAGKSAVARAILGSESVVDMGEDSAESLLGYEKPTSNDYARGKLGALLIKNDVDVRIVLDELGHMSNARALHRVWNGNGFSFHDGNRFVDTTSMSLIGTTNYPNRQAGVYPIHKELRSRFGGGLALENPEIPNPGVNSDDRALVAPYKVRQQLREYMGMHSQGSSVKPYINALVDDVSESGFFESIVGDSRIIQGVLTSVRAKRLVSEEEQAPPKKGTLSACDVRPIVTSDVQEIAAFSMGKILQLNNEGARHFAQKLGKMHLTEHEKAVVARRYLAGMAYKTRISNVGNVEMTANQIEDATKQNIDNTSYATSKGLMRKTNQGTLLDVLDQSILDSIYGNNTAKVTKNSDEQNGKRRASTLWLRRSN